MSETEGWSIVLRESRRAVTFRSLRVLAQGAHSCVHLARAEDGSLAAVKVATGLPERRAVDSLIEERIVAQLDHPNVVRYLGRAPDDPVLAYERVHENPLLLLSHPRVRPRLPDDPGTRFYPLPPRPALALAADLLRGLEHLHHRSFVHHDVKLANLMMRVPGLAEDATEAMALDRALAGETVGVVVDLGATRSAGFLGELNRGEVQDGRLAPSQLTPVYAAPEALADRPAFLPSIDVYGAALVMYSCLTGHAPYDHLREVEGLERLLELKRAEREGRVSPVCFEALRESAVRPVAGEVFGLLSACTSGDPDDRPSLTDARRFTEDLLALYSRPRAHGGRKPSRAFFGTAPGGGGG